MYVENLRQQFLAGHIDSFGVVGEGNVFIMPLIIPPIRKNVGEGSEKLPESKGFNFESFENSLESKENGPITRGRAKKDKAKTDAPTSPSPLGHLLLAVVEKDSKSHVKIDILDSLTQHVDRDVIRIRAMEVARIWLKTDAEAKFHFKSVPQQPLGSNGQ